LQCVTLRKFVCEPEITKPLPLKDIDYAKMDAVLQEFEKRRRAKLRRPVKLWWFDTVGDNGRIVFRREKNARSKLKLVERNEFRKTGDEKVFIFKKGGNALEICSPRELKRTLKVAEFIIHKLTRQDVVYHEVINSYKIAMVDEFVRRLVSSEIKDVTLLSIKVRNVPLANSPIMELQCSESVVPAVEDLEENHGLFLVTRSADILSLRIQLEGRAYTLKSRLEGDEIELLSDNRNLRDSDKDRLSQFLTEQIG
jgi:hypothetical protein